MRAERAFRKLLDHLRDCGTLSATISLLDWDQETHMPPGGAALRATQLAQLAEVLHRKRSSRTLGRLLEEAQPLAEGRPPDSDEAAILREAKHDHDRATRIPAKLAAERAKLRSLAREAWADAREKRDFAIFLPWLTKVFHLMRRWGEALSRGESPYDALVEDYEPGQTSAEIRNIFGPLETALRSLLRRIEASGRTVDTAPLSRPCPLDAQRAFAKTATTAIGFDYARGTLDDTLHPFCSTLSPDDIRLTSRYQERAFADGLYSALHEAGHGIYEQGLPKDHFGTPLCDACSFGVHESQSRLLENLVGRSLGFWRHILPLARKAFPGALDGATPEALYRAVNEVRPSFIRVDADEVTYNLHIFLRFDLEQALLRKDLAPEDLPGAWNERFKASFGMTPTDDAEGCLQDIHWSICLVGYFPTYTLGNVYAAQLFDRARKDLGDLDAAFARGEFGPLKDWLHERIHRHGRRYRAKELIERAAGALPSPEPLLSHLEGRAADVYGL
ncbi:MAG TPA: carboxypeptidase M32 [Planctomycetota bacterium]|nr:carboxypeptidase M32 [Planctomycetota bacterium]